MVNFKHNLGQFEWVWSCGTLCVLATSYRAQRVGRISAEVMQSLQDIVALVTVDDRNHFVSVITSKSALVTFRLYRRYNKPTDFD